jgi:hypothetical protein
LKARPDFAVPVDLQANAGLAARDAFKRATDAKAAWLACSATFCVAILESIGESNRLAMSDTDTATLHLSPRDIINAMTALHGTLTDVEVDALRLPLKKKLSALTDLPAHIVKFRGHLARLTTAGQAPLALDAYRLFLVSLSSFPVFHQYTFIVNGDLRGYATYIGSQHSNILAHSTLRPFSGNVEGYEDGASEDDGIGGDSIYPTSPPPSYPKYPTANAMQPYYPPHQLYPPQQCLPPPLALGSTLTPTPWRMVFTLTLPQLLPLPNHPQTRKATDKKVTKKTR